MSEYFTIKKVIQLFATKVIDVVVVDRTDNVRTLLKLSNSLNLCKVREELEKNSVIKMTNYTYFTKDGIFIDLSSENQFKLSDILDRNKIYLAKDPRQILKIFLIRKFKLENARNYNGNKDEITGRKVFIVENCTLKILELDDPNFHTVTTPSSDDLTKNKHLFLKSQLDILNLDYSIYSQNIRSHNSEEKSSTFKIKNIVKAILNINKVTFTDEFIDAVENAITSKDLNILKQVIEKFGQFVPTVIIFGGRLHYETTTYTGSLGIYRQSRNECAIRLQDSLIFGGDKIKLFENKEDEWMSSLQETKHWDIIEFRKAVPILELLPNNLKDKIRELMGKTILYSDIQDYNFKINDPNDKSHIVDLKMPQNLSSIFSNKDIDPQVFVTVSNMEADDTIFTCMLYTPLPSSIPQVIINCESNQKKVYQIKIRWIVVGYNLGFNSIINPEHFHFQSTCCDYNNALDQHSVLNIRTEYPMALFGTPVALKWDSSYKSSIIGHHFYRHDDKDCIYLYGYNSSEKKYFTNSLSNFKVNLLFTKHPNPDIFRYFKTGEDLFVEKTSTVQHTEFISLYKEEYNQFDRGFICRKNGYFFIKQPDWPDKHMPQSRFFVAVFNPKIKVQEPRIMPNKTEDITPQEIRNEVPIIVEEKDEAPW